MKTFASAIAAVAITLSAGSAFAAVDTGLDLDDIAVAPVAQTAEQDAADAIQVAYVCDYVILWDAWGNYYYEYVCY